MIKILTLIFATLFILPTEKLFSQTGDSPNKPPSEDALAQAAANPIASLISLPFQFNFNFGVGDYNRQQTTLNIQPVIPFRFFTWNVIVRGITPFLQKPHDAETGSNYGVGEMNFSMFFVPPEVGNKTKFTWGFGPAANIPIASTPEFGQGAFAIGPTFVAVMLAGKHWVAGVTFNQLWSYNPAYSHSTFFCQYFVTWNIKNGWFLNSVPSITANWKAPKGEQWNVPFGGGFGRVITAGQQPMRIQAAAFYNAVHPTKGAGWSLQFQYTLLFPHKAPKN